MHTDGIAKEISKVEVVPSARAEYIDKEMQVGHEKRDASSDRFNRITERPDYHALEIMKHFASIRRSLNNAETSETQLPTPLRLAFFADSRAGWAAASLSV